MAIEIKNGDLFTSNATYLCHQVNCMGIMGRGIAKSVREKFPNAYEEYVKLCPHETAPNEKLLGVVQFVDCGSKTIINMFAQITYGTTCRQTDYEAFRKCLKSIKNTVPVNQTIAFPFNIGCGLGGGNWELIQRLIKDVLGDSHHVEIWKLC